MNKISFLLSLSVAVLLESTITSIPLVLDVLIVFYVLRRKSRLLIPAFIAGIILDIFQVRELGQTNIFLLLVVFLVFLYEKKFEITTSPFLFFSSFIGGGVYLWM